MRQQNISQAKRRAPMFCVALALIAFASTAAAAPGPRELRVCADPDNLPFSNERLEGFENKIATLLAEDLNATLRYTWHSQRRGFIRGTLTARACDVVIGVPSGYDAVLSSKPYYRSSYVFVYRKNKGLKLGSFDDPVLRELKIGLHAFGNEGANAPPAHALARRGLSGNVIGFTLLNTAENPPGKIIDAVAAGEIDVAIVWGPFAGYFCQRQPVVMEIVAVPPNTDDASVPFAYDMALAVRRGEDAFKEEIDGVLERRRSDIQKILQAYGIPLVEATTLSYPQGRRYALHEPT